MGNTGWVFPPECNPLQGRVLTTDLEQSIRQSIRMILSTKRGERFLHPEFGCDVYKFLFHGTDYTTLKQIEFEISRSITAWEPRISELEVLALPDRSNPGKVLVEISYLITELNAAIQQEHSFENQ